MDTSVRSEPRHCGQSEPAARAERVTVENAMSAVNGRSEDSMVGEKAGKEEERTKTEREICATFVDGLRGGLGTVVWGRE